MGDLFDSALSNLHAKDRIYRNHLAAQPNANFADTLRRLAERIKPRGLQMLLGGTDDDRAEDERLFEQQLCRKDGCHRRIKPPSVDAQRPDWQGMG